ncbi:MAG TPA: ATP synthase F1 subunit gamma [Polyangiales bacterium]|nr:ATP synthase F1 subunit gamma [Polyangiales bacterium]
MANLKAIRKRISTVKNTRKITRAMKLVAAARLRKAQENITALRPYALQTIDIISSLAARASEGDGGDAPHPLLVRREPKRVMLVIITSDRGLAGAFNSGISKAAFKHYQALVAEGKTVIVAAVGRKGSDYFRRRGVKIEHSLGHVFSALSYEKAREIGEQIIQEYTEENLDAVYLCYNEFKSAITQKIVVERILPIEPKVVAAGESSHAHSLQDYLYEPDQKTLLSTLLPLYVNVEVYRALLESVASEHGARMTAMDNATNNAADMIQALTLQANRARQAAITTELMEIIGGAEALKG